MLKPENVPECVWRAAMSTYHKTLRKNPSMAWQEAVVAMVNAWPGMDVERFMPDSGPYTIHLPLPKDHDDD